MHVPPSLSLFQNLEKPELHLHFRGIVDSALFFHMLKTMRQRQEIFLAHLPPRVQDLLRQHPHSAAICHHASSPSCSLTTLQQLCSRLWSFSNPEDFFITYALTMGLSAHAEGFSPICDRLASYLQQENIIYAEVIFSVHEFLISNFSIAEVRKLLQYTQKVALEHGCDVRFIFDFVRNFPEKDSIAYLEHLLADASDLFVGITLGGDEKRFPAKHFRSLFQKASAAGLGLTCHAGEFGDATSVQEAIHLLEVSRIGHGISSIHCPHTLNDLLQHNITLEICPTSNVALKACASMKSHPAKRLYDHHIPISIASDDPGFFHTTVTQELALCHHSLGFSLQDIHRTLHQSFAAAFMPAAEKARYQERVKASCREHLQHPHQHPPPQHTTPHCASEPPSS